MATEDFTEATLAIAEQIPPGRVTTYGAIAAAIGSGGPRQVGAVMAREGGAVPWWRVVRADGSLPASHGARAREAYAAEGTPMRASGSVDLERAFWDPDPADLQLQPHPEGGWYRRTWASGVEVALPDGRIRPTATMIYFALPAGESSAWHVVSSDEIWLAHTGVVRLQYGGDGTQPVAGRVVLVGTDLRAGQQPQAVVPAGQWQRTLPGEAEALVSCVVSPGFDFDDFALA